MLLQSPLGVVGGPSISASLIAALDRYGLAAFAIRTGIKDSPFGLSDYSSFDTIEAIAGAAVQRHTRARSLQRRLAEDDIARVLHIGVADLAALPGDATEHYLFCDHTWHLARRYADIVSNDAGLIHEFDLFERSCYAKCTHIFAFGTHVADDLVRHYGVEPDKVSVVGCGVEDAFPAPDTKDYGAARLVSVIRASETKSSGLLVDAIDLACEHRPDIKLSIVDGDAPGARTKLRALLAPASLLVQPMLHAPGGPIFLEALAARTPVAGFDRHGLSAIAANGAFGFLASKPTAAALAVAILEALADPQRLAQMGTAGRLHVLNAYAWDGVARAVAGIIAGEARASLAA